MAEKGATNARNKINEMPLTDTGPAMLLHRYPALPGHKTYNYITTLTDQR